MARSYALYQALFGKVADVIRGKDLLLIPSGPLTQLPFHALVPSLPDEAAGVKSGDVLLAVGGVALGSVQNAIGAIRVHAPGTSLPLQLWRDGVETSMVAPP